MPNLMPRFNWGTEVKNVNKTLYNQLNDSYSATASVINSKPSKQVFRTDPPADDQVNIGFNQGDI